MFTGALLGRMRQCPICNQSFSICQNCDRGHWYCGHICSAKARRLSLKRAGARYRASDAGRLTHREAQRRYRRRKARSDDSEIYHSSAISEPSLNTRHQSTAKEHGHGIESKATAKSSLNKCHLCDAHIRAFIQLKRYPKSQIYSENLGFNVYDNTRDSS